MQSVMDTSDSVDTERSGLTRRQIIQGAALGGAAFWAVPVIDSVTNMAAAVGSGGVPYCYSSCIEQSNCGVNAFTGAICGGGNNTTCTDGKDLGVQSTQCPPFLQSLCVTATFIGPDGTILVPDNNCSGTHVNCSGQGSNGNSFAEKVTLVLSGPCHPGIGTCASKDICNTPVFGYASATMANGGAACYDQTGPGSSTSNVVTISSDGKTLTFDFSGICTSPTSCGNVAWNDLCFQVNCNGFTSGTSPAEKGC